MTKPIAKSLHTVTVLVQVARQMEKTIAVAHWDRALDLAMEVLQLDNRPDPYALRAAALKQLRAA